MSYIRAKKVDQLDTDAVDEGFEIEAIDFEIPPEIDLDSDEQLDFVLKVIEAFDGLAEGEALVLWKEVF